MKHLLTIVLCLCSCALNAQTFESKLKDWAAAYTPINANIKPSTVASCDIDTENKTIHIVLDKGFPEQHFTPATVENAYRDVRSLLPTGLKDYDLVIEADKRPIEDLVPNFFRKGKKDHSRMLTEVYKGKPWVTNISRPYTAAHGLEGNHIALWQSHGLYYKQEKGEWTWQRPRLFCTTEDLFTQTFVVPFIIPMLENAGAVVFTPRERDYQCHEVIIDNDQPNRDGTYIESFRHKQKNLKWKTAPKPGFAHFKDVYEACDSPFVDGTSRFVPTVSSARDEGTAAWIPNIPEEGKYAVYVTYQSYDNSATDATYTVFHKGGMTEFSVNQQMGGGTWVYLGTFEFDSGEHDYGMVTLSNRSESSKSIITADAVRFGGGMGNIVPTSYSSTIKPSGMPRWAEAAKYSTQWFGFPYKVHTQAFGSNDYNNDINSRSAAVNHLSGGSIYNPKREDGLSVPLDLTVAFHTDAGVKTDDAFVGSLGIYMTDFNDGKTGAGLDRYVSRDLASMFLTNMTIDLKKYNWQVRQLWNKNYGEVREPRTPACILEMLSHQNFADMRCAYDPHFKFDLARSIYKTIVKFIATEHNRDYAIQPLPVENFAIALDEKKQTATLSWSAAIDPLEPTAKPQSYIVYTRRGHQGFDNGVVVRATSHTVHINPDEVYSFKIAALNQGGESFPSEVLSCGISSHNRGTVLVVNAFTRLEGPKVIDTQTECGFDIEADPGVPWGAYTGFCGRQLSFDRSKAGIETAGGLGASGSECEGQTMMGNTFDYVFIHGNAIMLTSCHSFTSCSEQALRSGKASLDGYAVVDMIYGTQKQFNQQTNNLVTQYYAGGGKLLISAANPGCPGIGGGIKGTVQPKSITDITGCGLTFSIHRQMNPHSYCVPAPSSLLPSGEAFAILTYSDSSYAGIAVQGRLIRLGFPLESITDHRKLNTLTKAFLTFLAP